MQTNLSKSHEVEKIYMEQLRNIETSVYILHKKEVATINKIDRLKSPIPKRKDPYKPKFKNYIDTVPALILPIILVIVLNEILKAILSEIEFLDILLSPILNLLFIGCCVIGGIMALVGIFKLFSGIKEYATAMKKYNAKVNETKDANIKIVNTVKRNFERANSLVPVQNEIHKERLEAMKIRDNLYGVNWIPIQYRNIRVVYYIYNMVTTSPIGIEEALKYYLLQETNNKIDEVLHKMDTIIENQNEIIMNQAIMQAQNKSLIHQNDTIIKQNADITENTQLAAEYAQIGAACAKANAYFTLANYLK